MTENDIKHIMYGAVRELTRSSKYYYSGYHSHFTAEGKQLITEMMDLYAEKIDKAIKDADEQRSKDMVFNQLKGDSK